MLITVLVIQKTKHIHSLSILRPQVRFHKGVVDGFREWGRWRAGWAFLAINIHVKRRDKDSEVQIQGTLVRSPGARESAEVPQRMPGAPGTTPSSHSTLPALPMSLSETRSTLATPSASQTVQGRFLITSPAGKSVIRIF